MYALDSNLAIRVTKFYATSTLPMEDVAYAFNRSVNQTVLSKNSVSKCIYYCLFYRLVDEETENKVISKISSNIISHTIYSSKITYVHEKYETLKSDRTYYEDLNLAIKLRNLKDELNQVNSLDLESFLSSDDERDYVPPRNPAVIIMEMDTITAILETSENPQTQILLSRMKSGFSSFENEQKKLINKYKLL